MEDTLAPTPAPTPSKMQVDTPPPSPDDITSAVRQAREELASVITSLTQVLAAVAEGDPSPLEKPANGQEPTEAEKEHREEANKKRNDQMAVLKKRRSLAPVLARFDALRKAVGAAVGFHKQRVEKAEAEEKDVSAEDRQQLLDRRAQLIDEVRAKNKKIKILIDHLRELHRDILALPTPYKKPHSSQARRS